MCGWPKDQALDKRKAKGCKMVEMVRIGQIFRLCKQTLKLGLSTVNAGGLLYISGGTPIPFYYRPSKPELWAKQSVVQGSQFELKNTGQGV